MFQEAWEIRLEEEPDEETVGFVVSSLKFGGDFSSEEGFSAES